MRLTEKQEENVQVCETNLKRRIVGVKRAYMRRTDEMRVEVEVKENFKKKLSMRSLTYGNDGRWKTGKESRWPGSGGERRQKLRWGLLKRHRKKKRRMEKKCNRKKELETAEREKGEMKKIDNETEIMATPLTIEMPRNQQLNAISP